MYHQIYYLAGATDDAIATRTNNVMNKLANDNTILPASPWQNPV